MSNPSTLDICSLQILQSYLKFDSRSDEAELHKLLINNVTEHKSDGHMITAKNSGSQRSPGQKGHGVILFQAHVDIHAAKWQWFHPADIKRTCLKTRRRLSDSFLRYARRPQLNPTSKEAASICC